MFEGMNVFIFVILLFISGLSVRACSGLFDSVRGRFGYVRGVFLGVFGHCSGSVNAGAAENGEQNKKNSPETSVNRATNVVESRINS